MGIQQSIAENNVWFDDKLSDACLLCANTFTVFSRRHHCRSCGLLVCAPCSMRKLQFNKEGKTSLERACDKCFNKNHSKMLRKKTYSFKNKSYKMTPKEYLKMIVMETTLNGSYFTMIKAKNGDLSKNNHKMSKSVNWGFNKSNSKKKDVKDDKYSKHQASHSQAMNETNKALNKVHERGQKISELADKSERMADSAKNFNDLAKQLANKKW